MTDRKADALARGYKEGTPEVDYFMSYGHPRTERQPPAPTTLDQEIDRERRRRDAMAKDPLMRDQIPNEPPEVTARRNLANREKAGAAQQANEPIPEAPPPPPKRTPPQEDVPVPLSTRIRNWWSGTSEGTPSTTTTTTSPSTTSTTQPAPDSDAQAWEIINGIDIPSLSPEGQAAAQQLADAVAKGMPPWQAAHWAQSLR